MLYDELMEHASPLAIFVAAVLAFGLGAIWYSPLMFLKSWAASNQIDIVARKRNPMPPAQTARIFGTGFVFTLIAAIAFSCFVGAQPELKMALKTAANIGFCFVAACFGINYQFTNKPLSLWLIDGGYHFCQFMIYALVFGLWPH